MKIKYYIIIFVIIYLFYISYFKNIYIINHDNITTNDNDLMIKFTDNLNNIAGYQYPFGDNKFIINFSSNYFNFFKSIGTDGYHIVYKYNDEIVGSICARFHRGGWYICDLKILPEHRGNRLTFRLFTRKFIPSYIKSNKCYAISMYPNNNVKKLNKQFNFLHMKDMGFIYIYLVDYKQMIKIYDILVNYFNHKYNGFVDINNKKQLILDTGERLNVLHFYHSNNVSYNLKPLNKKYKYLFCLLEKDKYILNNIEYFGKATLYIYNMNIELFNDLGTYEI